LYRHHEFFPVVASTAVHLKHPLATRNFPSLSPAPKMRTAGQRDGNESREQAPPKDRASQAIHRLFCPSNWLMAKAALRRYLPLCRMEVLERKPEFPF
jgi:hypothetical protein